MPEISSLITVYNGEKYIKDAIESVINQNKVNSELIIINDGSTDNTSNILDRYKNNERILIINSDHIGRGKALNLAIAKSSGEYIAILDADDLFHPLKLKIQYSIMEENPGIGVLGTGSVLIGSNFTLQEIDRENEDSLYLTPKEVTNKLVYRSPLSHSSVLIRKNVLDRVSGYDDTRERQYDYDLWIRIAKDGWKLSRINSPLTYKRIHDEQNFERSNRIKHLASSIKLQKKAIRLLNAPKRMYLICYGRFMYGLLPRKIRMFIRNYV
ncbi:glycosyltransferase family 2 protein [Virgibacillus oceani]